MTVFDVVFALLESTFNVLAAAFLFSLFAEERYSKLRYTAFFALSVILLSATELFVTDKRFVVLLPLIITLGLSFIYKMRWYNRILFSCFGFALAGLADCITIMLVNYIFDVDLMYTHIKSAIIMGLTWSKVMLFVFIVIIRALRRNLFRRTNHLRTYVMVIAPISIFMMLATQYRLYLFQISLVTEIFWIALILNVGMVLSVIVILNITDELRRSAEEEAKFALIEKLFEQQEEQYSELTRHNRDILKIKHDQKNFLYGLLYDLDTKNYEDIRACVLRELQTVESFNVPAEGSGVIYLLVSHKAERAKSLGITVKSEYHDVKSIKMSPIDFAIMLGNALDNAIEAAEKLDKSVKREVSLLIKVHKGQVVVIIKNPIPDGVDVNDLRSTKKSGHHGFGILSMRNIVEQYGGELIFDTEDGLFTTYIVLKNMQ